jgi:hypothetical protein
MHTATLLNGDSKTYFTAAETAKFVRTALKTAFPGQKFSVRSKTYAGGASLSVNWEDGPTERDVDAVVDIYRGSGFDGMQDLKYSLSHWLLPNGTVQLAAVHHNLDAKAFDKPDPAAVRVHFGADYINIQRGLSLSFRRTVAAATLADYGLTLGDLGLDSLDAVATVTSWGPRWAPSLESVRAAGEWVTTLFHRVQVRLRGDGTLTHDLRGHDLAKAA